MAIAENFYGSQVMEFVYNCTDRIVVKSYSLGCWISFLNYLSVG